MRSWAGALLLLSLTQVALSQWSSTSLPAAKGFIRAVNGKFVDDDCDDFHFAGWNDAHTAEALAVSSAEGLPGDLSIMGPRDVAQWRLDIAVQANLRVMRLWGHGFSQTTLQTAPGVYDDQMLKALDYIMALAGQRNLKVIFSLGTNWDKRDSIEAFVGWSSTASEKDDFWTDEEALSLYEKHITFMVNRANQFTGVLYRDDPTIFAWDVLNEGKCDYQVDCFDALHSGYERLANHLRSQDSNHMITLGIDGFARIGSCAWDSNPWQSGEWSGFSGQQVDRNHALDAVDFVSIHLWPDNWGIVNTSFDPKEFIRARMAIARRLNKPLIVEEFGKWVDAADTRNYAAIQQERDGFFRQVYEVVQQSLIDGDVLRGSLFWLWSAKEGRGDDPGIRGVLRQHSTWTQQIAAHALDIQLLSGIFPGPTGCAAGGARVVGPASPADFEPFPLSDLPEDCRAVWGNPLGDVLQETSAPSPAQCCGQCRDLDGCDVWSYCLCAEDPGCTALDGSTHAAGSCLLKSSHTPGWTPIETYDPIQMTGWLGGAKQPSTTLKSAPTWDCGWEGATCTNNPGIVPELRPQCNALTPANLTCVSDREECHAYQGNMFFEKGAGHDYRGLLSLDVNSLVPGKPVTNAADCCSACQAAYGCNGWVYCNDPSGCGFDSCDGKSKRLAGTSKGLGPFSGGCAPGNRFQPHQCTLLTDDDFRIHEDAWVDGPFQPFTSGYINRTKQGDDRLGMAAFLSKHISEQAAAPGRPGASQCDVTEGTDLAGGDVAPGFWTDSHHACCVVCWQQEACSHFTYRERDGSCFLKDSDAGRKTLPGHTSGSASLGASQPAGARAQGRALRRGVMPPAVDRVPAE